MKVDFNGLPNEKIPAMKCLWSTLASVLPHAKLSLEANFCDIGGNSHNRILIIEKLSEAGYNISISDFIRSETLLEIVNQMTPNTNRNRLYNKIDLTKHKFDQISEKYKAEIYRIVADGFAIKSVIERSMELKVEKRDYIQMLDIIWPKLINNPLR
ncbi:unnamed protein product [Nezara viridula]|uniref:Carrier domain-containing protein n=1 Tax=Nezara viridula TaxID=85310 RepID=A0A9P0E637_NEZVI|nr:unnamed protein product [Nezara viridula]